MPILIMQIDQQDKIMFDMSFVNIVTPWLSKDGMDRPASSFWDVSGRRLPRLRGTVEMNWGETFSQQWETIKCVK